MEPTGQEPVIKRDPALESIVEGVEKIATHVTSTEERITKRVDEIETKTQQMFEALDGKVEKGFENSAEKFERYKKARGDSAISALRVQDTTEPLQAVLTDRRKAMIPTVKAAASHYGKTLGTDSALADPLVAASAADWLKMSAKLQCSKFGAEHRTIAPEFDKLDAAFSDMATTKAALQEDTSTEGGNLVPTIVESEILRLILDSSLIWQRLRQMPLTKKTTQVPDETTAVTVNWVAEEGTLTGGEPVFGQKTLTANKLAGRATMSMELVEDSNVAVLTYLQSVFAEKIGRTLDVATMEGTGTTSDPFTGVNGASGVNSVEASTGTVGDPLTYPLLVDIFVAGGEMVTREGAVWVMSPAIYGKALGLVDSNGQPIVKYATVETAPAGTILGRPIIVHNGLGSFTVGSDATGNIYFGPPSALIAGTRTGMRWDVTDQVNWATYQMDARLVGRFGYVVGVPGAWTKGTKFDND